MPATYRHIAGWTLIELCIVMVIVTMLVTMAIPSWQHHMQYTQLKAVEKTLQNAIHYVRALAISSQKSLSLCSREDNWANGFRVVASNPKHSCQHSKLLRQWHIKHVDKLSIRWNGFDKKQLLFSSYPERWAVNGRFTISLGDQKPVELVVNRLGHVIILKRQTGTKITASKNRRL